MATRGIIKSLLFLLHSCFWRGSYIITINTSSSMMTILMMTMMMTMDVVVVMASSHHHHHRSCTGRLFSSSSSVFLSSSPTTSSVKTTSHHADADDDDEDDVDELWAEHIDDNHDDDDETEEFSSTLSSVNWEDEDDEHSMYPPSDWGDTVVVPDAAAGWIDEDDQYDDDDHDELDKVLFALERADQQEQQQRKDYRNKNKSQTTNGRRKRRKRKIRHPRGNSQQQREGGGEGMIDRRGKKGGRYDDEASPLPKVDRRNIKPIHTAAPLTDSVSVSSTQSDDRKMASSSRWDGQHHEPIQRRTPASTPESFPSREDVRTTVDAPLSSVDRRPYTDDGTMKGLTTSARSVSPVSAIRTDPERTTSNGISRSPSSSAATTTTTLTRDGRNRNNSVVAQKSLSSTWKTTSSSSTVISPWVRRYLASRPKDMLLPVPRDYLADKFNLAQLPPIVERIGYDAMGVDITSSTTLQQQQQLFALTGGGDGTTGRSPSPIHSYPIFRKALQRILSDDGDDDKGPVDGGAGQQQQLLHHDEHGLVIPENAIQQAAEALYLMVHARFVMSPRGLEAIRPVMMTDRTVFGKCPRPLCRGTGLLPYGYSNDYTIPSGVQQHRHNDKQQEGDHHHDHHHHRHVGDAIGGQSSHHSLCHRYCPSCGEVWVLWESKTDGCAWGPSWCHFFLLSYGTQIFARELAEAAAARAAIATPRPISSSTAINNPRSFLSRQPLARTLYGYLYPGANNGNNNSNNNDHNNVGGMTTATGDQSAASSSSPPQSVFGFRIHPATPFGRPWNENGLSVVGGAAADGGGDGSQKQQQ